MRQLVGSLGIALNFVGVILMVRYGPPYPLKPLGPQPELSDRDRMEQDRRSLFGAVGVVCFAVGNAIFLITNAWNAD